MYAFILEFGFGKNVLQLFRISLIILTFIILKKYYVVRWASWWDLRCFVIHRRHRAASHPDELIDIHSASLWFLSPWSSRGTVELALFKNQETWASSQLPLACLLREAVAIPTRTRTEQKQVTSGTSGRLQGGHIHQRRSGLLNCVSARHAIKNISQQTDKTTCFFSPVDDKDDSRSIDHV